MMAGAFKDQPQIVGDGRALFRIERAPPGGNKVLGANWVAIGPLAPGAAETYTACRWHSRSSSTRRPESPRRRATRSSPFVEVVHDFVGEGVGCFPPDQALPVHRSSPGAVPRRGFAGVCAWLQPRIPTNQESDTQAEQATWIVTIRDPSRDWHAVPPVILGTNATAPPDRWRSFTTRQAPHHPGVGRRYFLRQV